MSSYKTGTVTVTSGSETVSGSSTAWQNAIIEGDLFALTFAGPFYEIQSISDDETLTLDRAYEAETAADQSYVVLKISATRQSTAYLASQVQSLLTSYATVLSLSGDDKRLTLDKAAEDDLAAIFLRTAGAERWRVGMAADDDLAFARSTDGSTFEDLVRFALDTGILTLGAGLDLTGDMSVGGDLDVTGALTAASLNGGPMGGFRNKLINGDFPIAQRGLSSTEDGYGSLDRWQFLTGGDTTHTHSREDFAADQTAVPGNPQCYARTIVVDTTDAANYSVMRQKIEDVRTLAGKTTTLTLYAKADDARNIAVELRQGYGTGGSPSSITSYPLGQIELSTVWKKLQFVLDLDDLADKTFGTNDNSALEVLIWFSAGSDNDAGASSLPNQSGTFDVAHVSLVEGDATGEEDPFSPRHIAQELQLCQRYFCKNYNIDIAPGTSNSVNGRMRVRNTFGVATTGTASFNVQFPVAMRVTPSVTAYSTTTGASGYVYDSNIGDVEASISDIGQYGCSIYNGSAIDTTNPYIYCMWTAEAEL